MAEILEAGAAGEAASNIYYAIDTRTVMDSVRALGPQLRGRLLEVGSGNLPYRTFIRAYVSQYVASDYQRTTALLDLISDGAQLSFRSGVFDSVLCTQVLEHVPDPEGVLSEICRVLRPGGVALVTAPLNAGIHMAPTDYYRFTEYGLRELCDHVGLMPELIVERGGRIASAAQAALLVFENDCMPTRRVGAAVLRRCVAVLSWAIRRWALPLDRRFPIPGNPLGYALLARKPTGF